MTGYNVLIPRQLRARAARARAAARRLGCRARLPLVLVAAAGIAQALTRDPFVLMAIAAVAVWKIRDAVEGFHLRRSGGRAAQRQRNRWQGSASARELRAHLSAHAVLGRLHVIRPSLAGQSAAAVQAGYHLGRTIPPRPVPARWGHEVMAPREDCVLKVTPPRGYKTASMAGDVIDAPGCAVVTSTRVDIFRHTARNRLGHGPAWTLNADGDGGIPSTLRWPALTGCHTPAGAIQAAGYLMDAAPKSEGSGFWDAAGAQLLRLMMHAAALGGYSILDAREWVGDPSHPEPGRLLGMPGAAPGWDAELDQVRSRPADMLGGIIASADSALTWLADPAVAAMAAPAGTADLFTAGDLIRNKGTLYLIGADRPHSSLAPFFALLTAHIFETGNRLASHMPGGRLDPPGTLVLDEAPSVCPVPLDRWTSFAGGSGWSVVIGAQSLAQIRRRWGLDGAEAILANCTVKMIFGGFDDPPGLADLSAICGDRRTWHHVKHPDGTRTREYVTERAWPAERIRLIPRGEALLVAARVRPAQIRVTPVWNRRDYSPVAADLFTRRPEPQRQAERLALTAAPEPEPGEDQIAQEFQQIIRNQFEER